MELESESVYNSESEDELELLLHLAYYRSRLRKRRKQRKMFWIRPIFTRRREQGEYHNLLQEMRLSDPDSHFRYLRMSRERFDSLLEMVWFLLCTVVND